MAEKRFVVIFERGDGWWVASIPDVKGGCHTQGRNLEQTRRNIRECLSIFIGDAAAETAVFEERIMLPPGVKPILDRVARKAARLARLRKEYEVERRDLIQNLDRRGFSNHDVGALLGISKPRVSQILSTTKAPRKTQTTSKS